MKKMQLTMMVFEGDDGYLVGQIEEYPAVASQGKTMNELKANLKDALKLYLEFQKDQIELKNNNEKNIKKKTLVFEQ